MPDKYLLSSAYFPPVNYFSLISGAELIFIEKEENYLKQTYRNRCLILSANGPAVLTVPVLAASNIKTKIKEIRIDYSKRWPQVHLRALISSYKSSPYFEYYFDDIEKLITSKPEFLFDINMHSLEIAMRITGISTPVNYTSVFEPVRNGKHDFRYTISPKKEKPGISSSKEYSQVFSNKFGFTQGLSILDLIFNYGPDSINYL
jgi:hypothetical protein